MEALFLRYCFIVSNPATAVGKQVKHGEDMGQWRGKVKEVDSDSDDGMDVVEEEDEVVENYEDLFLKPAVALADPLLHPAPLRSAFITVGTFHTSRFAPNPGYGGLCGRELGYHYIVLFYK
jgi:hypothetical protein